MISVQGKFLCNNITEGFTFFRYNRDTKFERGTKHWQKEWQVSIKKDVLPAEYVKILVRWQRLNYMSIIYNSNSSRSFGI